MAEALKEIIKRTNKADPAPADRAALQAYIAEHGTTEIARIGNASELVIAGVLQSVQSTHLVHVGIVNCLDTMKQEMGYADASPLEQLLIYNIMVAWLRYHMLEMGCTQAQQQNSMALVEHWEKRVTLAHRRYLRAIETLARVRRLLKDPPTTMAILLKQQLGIVR